MGILDGRIAVITGGSRGFGLAIAQAYAYASSKSWIQNFTLDLATKNR
jgi:NAD(P)-dependent dehydrogenase (short-subunit alcohol dehydrogenase family)